MYRAEHSEHDGCAVKILKERLRKDHTAVERFLREAGYGDRVKHPGVVQTYQYGQEDGLYFLALEWVNGEPLSDFVHRSGRLAPTLVAHMMGQLADGLTAAHVQGIIHRDLKPENIMYDPSGKVIKLLDFGIARDAQLDASERLTRTGFFVGTLQYVAPEALSGELVSESADIFSVAKITYFLLTGTHPHGGRTPREVFQQLLTQPPLPLNQAVKGLTFPPALEVAVMKGLERDPAKRQATVREFADDLERAASGEASGAGAAPSPRSKKTREKQAGLLGKLKSMVGKKEGEK